MLSSCLLSKAGILASMAKTSITVYRLIRTVYYYCPTTPNNPTTPNKKKKNNQHDSNFYCNFVRVPKHNLCTYIGSTRTVVTYLFLKLPLQF